MGFKPIQKLAVTRTLATADIVTVGSLVQSSQGVFFQYDPDYLSQFGNLSPFTLTTSTELQLAPKTPHAGLHGLFDDSLPDGWGLLLQDRIFRQNSVLPTQLTAMDRLAFVGSSGIGALAFSPTSQYQVQPSDDVDVPALGLAAQALFDGQTDDVLTALVAAGSSGGARPKAQVFIPSNDPQSCHTHAQIGDEAWLVKFTSKNLSLGHEEGVCEAVYLHLAEKAQLQPPEWRLLDAPKQSGAQGWLAVKRFDWVKNTAKPGRRHMHSVSGLLDADFRVPSLDYETLIKASRQLCQSPAVGQLQFRRAIFNLFAGNQDDHSKNWAFLQDDNGQWTPAPFYDVTFSPHPFKEHATAFSGYGRKPPLKTIQKLANHAGFSNWTQAQQSIIDIVEVVASFAAVAKDFGVHRDTIKLICMQLEDIRQENKGLL